MNPVINVALINDEPGCPNTLEYVIRRSCPGLNILGAAADCSSASILLQQPDLDIAFIDIDLLGEEIFGLLLQLARPDLPLVFISADSGHAMQAFRFAVLDYLLKPLDGVDLDRCYRKILHQLGGRRRPAGKPAAAKEACSRISLRQGDALYRVEPSDIIMLKARGFYTEVSFLHQGGHREVIVSKPLGVFEKSLDAGMFRRVHRSFLINVRRVLGLRHHGRSTYVEMEDVGRVPIAKRRAGDFFIQGSA